MLGHSRRRTKRGEELPPLRERVEALRRIPRFVALVWRAQPTYAAVMLVTRIVRALGPVALLWISKLVIDGVVANIGASEPDWRGLVGLIALQLAIALGLGALSHLSTLVEGLLGAQFANQMSLRVMRHAATLDLACFEDPAFKDCLDRARSPATGPVLLGTLLNISQRLLTLATLLTALLAHNVWLLALLLAAMLPSFIGETRFAAISYSLLFRTTPERRELDYLRFVTASDATAKEVKLFGLAEFFVGRHAALADRQYQLMRSVSVRRALSGILLGGFSTIAYYGAVFFMVGETVKGIITLGTLTFLMATFHECRSVLELILSQFAMIYEQSLFLRDHFTFFEMKPQVTNRPDARAVPRPIRRGFVFDDVGFRYPGREGWALRHVSFELNSRERIALVGQNGAGKTTLVKLLTRLYDPNEGRILLDGIDLREYDLDALWGEVGVIFQDFVRYDLIARENIAVGRIEALQQEDRIREAARKSLALGVVDRLERGLDHMLGRRFAGGTALSGGEWQKIALARAYMRDAQVLVLDEPTAALDARAEHEVFQRFSELTYGRMALLISHRFSTVRMADRILVLEGGRLVEAGTHEGLVTLGKRYAELFSLQAAGYR